MDPAFPPPRRPAPSTPSAAPAAAHVPTGSEATPRPVHGTTSPRWPARTAHRTATLLGAAILSIAALLTPTAASAATAPTSAQALQDCPGQEYLAPNERRTYNNYVFTNDASGRPQSAEADFGTLQERPGGRDTACTRRVGQYAGVGAGYDGGHLIADVLYGPSIRQNLVPMQGTTVNRGIYLDFERAVRRCLDQHGTNRLQYIITLAYPDILGLVPYDIVPTLTVRFRGVDHDIQIHIPNQQLTPKEKADLKDQLDQQTAAAGCPRRPGQDEDEPT